MSAANAGLFGRVALASKLITADQLQTALHEHAKNGQGRHLGQVLIDLGMITPKQLEQLVELQKRVVEKARAQQGPDAGGPPAAAAAAAAKPAPAATSGPGGTGYGELDLAAEE